MEVKLEVKKDDSEGVESEKWKIKVTSSTVNSQLLHIRLARSA